jgi:hypothetical protein
MSALEMASLMEQLHPLSADGHYPSASRGMLSSASPQAITSEVTSEQSEKA